MESCSVFSFPLFLLVVMMTLAFHSADATTDRTVLFIFGDSTVDVGTINDPKNVGLKCPYGIDYPGNISTGRFSNGYNLADELARRMGHDQSPPPFRLNADGTVANLNYSVGMNFACGAAGIYSSTGEILVPDILQFGRVRNSIKDVLGEQETQKLLSKALFIVSVGGDDFFAYLLKSGNKSVDGAINFLLDLTYNYGKQLENLYGFGARKFGIVGLPPLGNCPYVHAQLSCEQEAILNLMVKLFSINTNTMLKEYLPDGIEYSFGNVFDLFNDVINNPSNNFSDVRTACWNGEPGWTEGGQTCKHWKGTICDDRDQYLFFDGIHPTQKAAGVAAEALYSGGKNYVEPINFRDLASSGSTDPTQKAAEFGASSLPGRKTKYVSTH
ncbi:hypothetical protein Tsubulata_015717 [Turnera subulata]|uniref:GDSL esterase/lipase n=1 Tax=Turnera subulata TaxID=218843 RepID=A0A9Q0FFL5_9ROSI|nr:hypothetical protein Tsubulata_015717 [Turnera subulata]